MSNRLITGEYTDHPNQLLIEEYNQLTYELNRELGKMTEDEAIKKYKRVVYLFGELTSEYFARFSRVHESS